MVTVSLSMLSSHEIEQLGTSLKVLGVDLPKRGTLTVKFVASTERSRSRTRRIVNMDIFDQFPIFSKTQFKNFQNWNFKKISVNRILTILRNQVFPINSDRENISSFLSCLVWQIFRDKLGLASLVEFSVLDFVISALIYQSECMEIDIFVRLLQGFYGIDDFVFFQFIYNFIQPGSMITQTDCRAIMEEVFAQDKSLLDSVLNTLNTEFSLVGQKSEVDSMYLIYISLWVFHHQRGAEPVQDSVDKYVDSIISLKAATQSMHRESFVNMESVVSRVLQDACRETRGDVGRADLLMQHVMNNNGPAPCIAARDRLMEAVSKGEEIEDKLWDFCISIGKASRFDQVEYRNYLE